MIGAVAGKTGHGAAHSRRGGGGQGGGGGRGAAAVGTAGAVSETDTCDGGTVGADLAIQGDAGLADAGHTGDSNLRCGGKVAQTHDRRLLEILVSHKRGAVRRKG